MQLRLYLRVEERVAADRLRDRCNTVPFERIQKASPHWGKVCLGSIALYYSSRVLFVVVALAMISGSPTQDAFTRAVDSSVSSASPSREVLSHVIDGLKEAEHAQYLYERIERVETRKQAGD